MHRIGSGSGRIVGGGIRRRWASVEVGEGKKNLWQQIRYVLNVYWQGSKLLVRNAIRSREIRQKTMDEWNRSEREHYREYAYDIRVGIPFVTLFALPIVGYSAPLLALLSPKSLPSTLILPQQKKQFVLDDAAASSTLIRSLIRWNARRVDEGRLPSNLLFVEMDARLSSLPSAGDGEELSSLSRRFDRWMGLADLPVSHLRLLHQSVVHSSAVGRQLLSKTKLCSDLELWQWHVLQDDRLIVDVGQLSVEELVFALHRRGIYFHSDRMAKIIEQHQTRRLAGAATSPSAAELPEKVEQAWRRALQRWLAIHLHLYRTNSISTSFLVHVFPLLRQRQETKGEGTPPLSVR